MGTIPAPCGSRTRDELNPTGITVSQTIYTTKHVASHFGVTPKRCRQALRAQGIRCGSGARHAWNRQEYDTIVRKLSPVLGEPPAVLLREDREGIGTLTLNRPERYNALSEALLEALQAGIAGVGADDSIRVVVLAARGPAFCTGHDLREMRRRPDEAYYRNLFARCSRMMQSLVACPKPVIARVQGIATAAGCQLVASADLAVASTEARFAVSGIRQGLFCSTPSVALSRNVGRKRAFEMLVTGEFIDAATALEYGLVNRVVPPDRLDAEVDALARSIAANPPVAVETGKRMFYRQLEEDLAGAYRYAGEVMACNMMAGDAVEGIDAFLEKREPKWRDR